MIGGALFSVTSALTGAPVNGRAKRFLVACACLLLSVFLRLAMSSWFTPIPYLLFFPMIVAVPVLCGWRYGIAVVVASAGIVYFRFLPEPGQAIEILRLHLLVGTAGYIFIGCLIVAMVAALSDLIGQLQAARAMQVSLFHELQHRVANNMQIVASTLAVARRELGRQDAELVIERASARIGAMAKLHRRLYDPDAYRDGLRPILEHALRETFRDVVVELRVRIEAPDLTADQMTMILLLVNEAALNAAKHVFQPGAGSLFEVTLLPLADNRLRLRVRDDGPGMPLQGREKDDTPRYGVAIMQSFASQLGGALQILDEPGMVLCVDFNAAIASLRK